MNLSLEKIKIDGGTQSRAKIQEATVAEYADAMKEGAVFPPVTVFHDGAEYFLADGFHRYFAAKKAGSPGIKCDIREGTLRDAVLFSLGANHDHGLPRTSADKRKAVLSMLQDEEWKTWSDRDVARQCRVSPYLVSAIRKEYGLEKTETKYKQGDRVVTREEKSKEEPEEFIAEFSEEDVRKETIEAAVEELQRENQELQDKLTIAMAASSDDLDREMAESVIKDLRAQIRVLEIELKEVKISRDTYLRENAELKKQITSLLKKLKKLEG